MEPTNLGELAVMGTAHANALLTWMLTYFAVFVVGVVAARIFRII